MAPRVVFVTATSPSGSFQAQYRGGRPVSIITKSCTGERLLRVIDEVVARDV